MWACHNAGYVNSTTHICCGGRPHFRKKSSSSNSDAIVCCGSEAIDLSYQACCHDVGLTAATPYIKERQRCCGGKQCLMIVEAHEMDATSELHDVSNRYVIN